MLDHLDDLESDFSAIHGVRDMLAMPTPKFLRMAERLPAYRGMMRNVVEQEAGRRQDHIGTAEVIPLTSEMARTGLADPNMEYVQVNTST